MSAPRHLADATRCSYLFTEVLDGRNARLADGVQRALGREPRDFRDYARATAATGVWTGEAAALSGYATVEPKTRASL